MDCIFSCTLSIQRNRKWDSSYSDSLILILHVWTIRIYAKKCKINWLHLSLPKNYNLTKNPTVMLEANPSQLQASHAVHWEKICYDWSHFIWKQITWYLSSRSFRKDIQYKGMDYVRIKWSTIIGYKNKVLNMMINLLNSNMLNGKTLVAVYWKLTIIMWWYPGSKENE